jgi:hypothetical protein
VHISRTYLIAETSGKKSAQPCSSPAIDMKNECELYSIAFMNEYQIIFSPGEPRSNPLCRNYVSASAFSQSGLLWLAFS